MLFKGCVDTGLSLRMNVVAILLLQIYPCNIALGLMDAFSQVTYLICQAVDKKNLKHPACFD